MSGATGVATTFWRLAGMSYLQYVNKSASTIRMALKEPAKRKALALENFGYHKSVWEAGVQGEKQAMGNAL
eukprot:CAMPEP_0178913524 /NCGR_PEP_ID=MMETSP0786-20121207/10892_1 /TAXON_ID=186022 /ORGANISM="Thalassionema frauenfeldii, Strain CCMP 1798" /LENGTH=70 /DNA_ID=CAMNT_0020586279 /DNA_START=66 /DNA_END=278 /DNA_ORIENTATION=-